MIKIENTEVIGWEHAIRGMRNPKNSWDRTDSTFLPVDAPPNDYIPEIGENDKKLMTTLRNAGTDHRKFMRMIVVYADITAPLYWWKEYDTYKVGTVANSCSTMHKIQAKEFTLNDFSHEHILSENVIYFGKTIERLNNARNNFNIIGQRLKVDKSLTDSEKKHLKSMQKEYWWQMIQLLPSSYNQKRTVMLNYEVLANQYKSRKDHKLDEWHEYCHWIESLPYSELITG